MNLNPNARLSSNDQRKPGGGPTWVIPTTGKISQEVREAAERCHRVAELLRETRRELQT